MFWKTKIMPKILPSSRQTSNNPDLVSKKLTILPGVSGGGVGGGAEGGLPSIGGPQCSGEEAMESVQKRKLHGGARFRQQHGGAQWGVDRTEKQFRRVWIGWRSSSGEERDREKEKQRGRRRSSRGDVGSSTADRGRTSREVRGLKGGLISAVHSI